MAQVNSEFRGLILDDFQVQAISAVLDGKNVLVSAPTGSGKTLIAEYIADEYMREGKTLFYTSPIKALSNQKYIDFSNEFGKEKVGLITGDIVINQDAPLVIMTTEIFRNMIFEKDDRLQNLQTVVFDEIHYINDIDRGTVWEESLIFAPQHVNFLCLSATVSNPFQFSKWLTSIRERETEVIIEKKRAVPLEYWVLSLDGKLYEVNKILQGKKLDKIIKQAVRKRLRRYKLLEKLVQVMIDDNKLPAIFFAFSRKLCEFLADKFNSNFLNHDERKKVEEEFEALIDKYQVPDLEIVEKVRNLILNGVAYHHAGLLPQLKLVVEQLFAKGYIKLLFATETFAVGVNMPSRAVAFESLMKFDGYTRRPLKTLEFQQMSGRAGRRGKDKKGWVYTILDLRFPDEAKKILSAPPEPLKSQFDMSYSTILNLFSENGKQFVKEFASKSFSKFEVELRKNKVISKLEKKIGKIECDDILLIKDFYSLESSLNSYFAITNQKKFKKIKKKLVNHPCFKCKNRKQCLLYYKKYRSLYKQLEKELEKQWQADERTNVLIDRRIEFLKHIDYIATDESGLLPRGEFAKKIFGYEIELTEAYFEGFIHELEPEEIVMLIGALVYDERKGVKSKRLPKNLKKPLIRFDLALKKLRKQEFLETGVLTIKQLQFDIAYPVWLWANQREFEDLLEVTTIKEGDLIRVFNQIAEMLKQLRVAIPESALKSKLRQASDLVLRGVADAKTFLLGKEGEEYENYQEE